MTRLAEARTRTVRVELGSSPSLAQLSTVEDAKTRADRYRRLSLASQDPDWGPGAARGSEAAE